MGNPVISYQNRTNYDLKLAVCGDATCTSKTLMTVDSMGTVCSADNSLQLNSLGNPVISYCDFNGFDLKLAVCSDATCTAPTLSPTVDPTTAPTLSPTDPTLGPTVDPTTDPTSDPTLDPTTDPTVDPTSDPTLDPTTDPTVDPTDNPTAAPTMSPTAAPTDNIAPKGKTIPSQKIQVDHNFVFILATKYFEDPDGDTLTLNATEAGQSSLPSWLTFDPSSNTLSGIPKDSDIGEYIIQVTATDPQSASVSQYFTIDVIEEVTIEFPSQGVTAADVAKIFGSVGGGLITLSGALAAFVVKRKGAKREKVKELLLAGEYAKADKLKKASCCNCLLGLSDKDFNKIKTKVEETEYTAAHMLISGEKLYAIRKDTTIPNERLKKWEGYWKAYPTNKEEAEDVLDYFKEQEQDNASRKNIKEVEVVKNTHNVQVQVNSDAQQVEMSLKMSTINPVEATIEKVALKEVNTTPPTTAPPSEPHDLES